MPGFATKGAAPLGKVQELLRINSPGQIGVQARNLGTKEVLLSFIRHGGSVGDRPLYAQGDTPVSELVSSGESLSTPVIPRSLVLLATGKPTLYDRDGDGKLRIFRTLGVPLATSPAVSDGVTSIPTTKQFTAASGNFIVKEVRAGDILQITNGKDAGRYTIVTRDSATQLTVREKFTVGSLTGLSWAVFPSDLLAGTIDYFTGKVTMTYPTGDAPLGKAAVRGTCTFPVALDPGMTLIATADTGGGGTATWDAGAAVAPGGGGTFAAMANETMEVKVGPDTAPWQLITLGVEAAIGDAITTINAQLTGALASLNVDQVDLTTDQKGTGARIRTRNVAAGITTKLGIANNDDHAGTGDVDNIAAVSFAEFKLRIETDMTTVNAYLDDGGVPELVSGSAETGGTSTIQVTGGTGNAAFGFNLLAHTGAQADAEKGILAAYQTRSTISAGSSGQYTLQNYANEEVIVGAVAREGNSEVSVDYAPVPNLV